MDDAGRDEEVLEQAARLWRRDDAPANGSPLDYMEKAAAMVATRRLMKRFVSLGDNCEFGFAQRAFGAEPLDLLRWASTPLPVLLRLLDHRFERIGAPDRIRIRVAPNGEYMVDHLEYGFTWHAFAKAGEVAAEQLHRRECLRLPRLAEMLVDELEAGDRIFVVKGPKIRSADDVAPLRRALRLYGAPTLLYATLADADHPAGTVVHEDQDLVHGYADRFSNPAEVPTTTPVENWRSLCEQAAAALDAAGTGPGTPRKSGDTAAGGRPKTGIPAIYVENAAFRLSAPGVDKAAVFLLSTGRIVGSPVPKFVNWTISDGALEFSNLAGHPTARFGELSLDREGYALLGSTTAEEPTADCRLQSVTTDMTLFSGRRPRPAGKARIAVLLRTHIVDSKVSELHATLMSGNGGFDVYPLVDETNGRPDTVLDRTIWHSEASLRDAGFTLRKERLLWWCGDLPLYAAMKAKPDYDYYIMLEGDVHFTNGDARTLEALAERLRSGEFGRIDAAGMRFRREFFHAGSLHEAAFSAFPEVYSYFFPFVVLSRPANSYLQSQRLQEASRDTPPEKIAHCESFVPSALLAAGFTCIDLNVLLPGCYSNFLMCLTGLYHGLPRSTVEAFRAVTPMVHPVFSDEEFLGRVLEHYGRTQRLPNFISMMDGRLFQEIPEKLRMGFRDRALGMMQLSAAE